ncbi:MAG: DUF4937 domain-containing protein [Phycisphaerae bacterium]
MILKYIICRVRPERRDQFSRGQQAWRALRNVDGFGGQFGGWHSDDANAAHIIGLWRDAAAYDAFMANLHDRIFESNEQQGTYDGGAVTLWDRRLPIPGAADSMGRAIGDVRFVRIARCQVRPDRMDHFVHVQQTVWNPGMAAAGMLHGAFCRARNDEHAFLVCSLWPSEADHRRYREGVFHDLRRQAEPDRDCTSISGALVTIENAWQVTPGE